MDLLSPRIYTENAGAIMRCLPVNALSSPSVKTPAIPDLPTAGAVLCSCAMHILLVEDDPAMHTTLQRALARCGMQVHWVGDGLQALARWTAHPPDAVVLDLSLPGMDGLDVLARARQQGLRTPVLILTARGTVGDRVLGLNTGADDYLAKPFDLDELEARLRALLRRGAPAAVEYAPPSTQLGHIRYEHDSGAIYHLGEPLDFTPRERALMHALLARPGQAVAKERLYALVFPGAIEVQYEAIEVVVYRLRKKLAGTGVDLVTLRGLGYLLKISAPAES